MNKEQSDKKYGFKYVFLNCIDILFVLDFENESIEKIKLPENAAYLFDSETEKLRHTRTWEDGSCLK